MFKPKRVSLGTVAALVASVAFLSLAPAGGAHVAPPTVTALHAFIGDQLFGLDTPEGTLFGILPDEQTPMASSTKIWTLDLTVHALDQGVVHLDDQVTINAFEAAVGGSTMADIKGTPLEEGEVVSLELLIRGMMYPSGNNAAYAIARYVAQAYLGPGAGWQDFVTMMNDHAAAAGLTNTHFANPDGGPGTYTTARELSEMMQHGLQQPYFAQVERFPWVWTGISQGPSGPKTYSWYVNLTYPGLEAWKGGSGTDCTGPNQGCSVMSAKRIGRRIVLAFMQGVFNEEWGMFDYGFGQIFHPDLRGTSSPLLTAVDRQDVDCLANGRVLSAVLPPSGPVSLALWQPDVDGSLITKLQEASLPGSGNPTRNGVGPAGDVAVTHLSSSDFVMATRKGASVELSRWAINRAGGLTLLASGISAGSASMMGLQPVYGDTFLTAMTTPDPDHELVLKSWRLEGSGLTLLDTFKDGRMDYGEVAIAGTRPTDASNGRAVTAAVQYGGYLLVNDVWAVDQATGKISRLGELTDPFQHAHVAIAPLLVKMSPGERTAPEYFATAYRGGLSAATGPGDLEINVSRIDATGEPVHEGELWNTGIPADQVRLAPLGTGGLMSAIRGPQGYVKLLAWDVDRQPDDSVDPDSVSEHDPPAAASLDLCRVPSAGHSEGDYVTGTKDLDGLFRLRTYRSGDRPY